MYRNLKVVLTLHDEQIGCFNKERVIFSKKFKAKYEKYRIEPDFFGRQIAFLFRKIKKIFRMC